MPKIARTGTAAIAPRLMEHFLLHCWAPGAWKSRHALVGIDLDWTEICCAVNSSFILFETVFGYEMVLI